MSVNSVSTINFSTVYGNPTAQIAIDNTGDLLLSPATDAAVLFNNLSLSGTSSSDPMATITADASGDITLTPASGAICTIGGVELYTKDGTQYIQSNGFSNLNIGNGDENAIYLQSTNYILLNSLSVDASATPTISTSTTDSDLYIGGSGISNTTCSNIGMYGTNQISLNYIDIDASSSPTISLNNSGSTMYLGGGSVATSSCSEISLCATNTIELNYLQVSAATSPTIQPYSSSDSITLSANTLNFTPSAGYLRMSQTSYFSSVGTSVQSFTLPCGGVFLMTMVANANSGDQASTPSLSDLWYVFSTGSSNVITPYSTSNEPVSGYFVGVNANGVIGVQSSTTSNTISVAVYESDGYFYNFYLTMIS